MGLALKKTTGRRKKKEERRRRREKNLHKGVDSQNGQIRLALGIIHDVQINKLFQLQIISHHTFNNLGEQNRDVPEKRRRRIREKKEKRKEKKKKKEKEKNTNFPTVMPAIIFLMALTCLSSLPLSSSVLSSCTSPVIEKKKKNIRRRKKIKKEEEGEKRDEGGGRKEGKRKKKVKKKCSSDLSWRGRNISNFLKNSFRKVYPKTNEQPNRTKNKNTTTFKK